MTTPRRYRVALAGGSVHVTRAGAGRPLLLLHGGGGVGPWIPLYERLAADFDLVIPEHPGFGDSDDFLDLADMDGLSSHYAGLVARLGLEQPVIVGISFGGWLAAELASRDPSLTDVLVLVAAVGLSVPDAPITDIFALSPEETRERLWHDPAIAAQVPVDTSQAAIGLIRRNRTALARFGQDPLLFDPGLEPRLPAITARTLVIWPASDRIVPRGVAERFAGRIPNATLQVLPEAGHGVQMEQPEALADRIRSFAAGAPVV